MSARDLPGLLLTPGLSANAAPPPRTGAELAAVAEAVLREYRAGRATSAPDLYPVPMDEFQKGGA